MTVEQAVEELFDWTIWADQGCRSMAERYMIRPELSAVATHEIRHPLALNSIRHGLARRTEDSVVDTEHLQIVQNAIQRSSG